MELHEAKDELDFILGKGEQGLCSGDTVVTIFGGTGANFLAGLLERAQAIGATIYRTAPNNLKRFRDERNYDKKDDANTLVEMFRLHPELFHQARAQDRAVFRLRVSYMNWSNAQRLRILAENHIDTHVKERAFLDAASFTSQQQTLEQLIEAEKARDETLKFLRKQEGALKRVIGKSLKGIPIWDQYLDDILGVGPSIASQIIVTVGDIARFTSVAAFCKFCGQHCDAKGKFPRNRRGEASDWNNIARQAFYLLRQQFVYQKDPEWGRKYRDNLARLNVKHPEPVMVENEKGKKVKRYTKAHLNKMALIKTCHQFCVKLWKEWRRLEGLPTRSPAEVKSA